MKDNQPPQPNAPLVPRDQNTGTTFIPGVGLVDVTIEPGEPREGEGKKEKRRAKRQEQDQVQEAPPEKGTVRRNFSHR